MDSDELYVDVSLVNEKVRFLASTNLRPEKEIAFDYVPPVGDGDGYLGLELLLTSFAGCVSTAIVFLLRRMGHTVTVYKMKAEGIRRENPISLEKINAEITLGNTAIPDADVQKAIALAAGISPVWLAIRNNVQVKVTYKEGQAR
jgi:putative redox protein